ncbi:MAG: imidazole glycerol phosphate synthase cyclase subunit [Ramlibacter sp.]
MMRIIPRLDIKGSNLIKGIHLEGLRVVGDPHDFALQYYQQGADELVFMDVVASLYGRNNLSAIIARAADQIYIPITAGGGVRNLEDVRIMLRSGADKVAVNTAAIKRPDLITEIAKRYGAQCFVLSIEAKRRGPGQWEAYTDNGRERTGRGVVAWAQEAVARGAGEILLTSIDQEGTRKGYDLELLRAVCEAVNVPVICSGGFSDPAQLAAMDACGCTGASIADALHWKRTTIADIKQSATKLGVEVRH